DPLERTCEPASQDRGAAARTGPGRDRAGTRNALEISRPIRNGLRKGQDRLNRVLGDQPLDAVQQFVALPNRGLPLLMSWCKTRTSNTQQHGVRNMRLMIAALASLMFFF